MGFDELKRFAAFGIAQEVASLVARCTDGIFAGSIISQNSSLPHDHQTETKEKKREKKKEEPMSKKKTVRQRHDTIQRLTTRRGFFWFEGLESFV